MPSIKQRILTIRNLQITAAWTLAVLATAACSPGNKIPGDVANVTTCSVAPATVATWFKSGTVIKDGEVTPADSVNFTDIPNCDFYVWSERMFLWLTSPTPPSYGGGGGRIFASPAFFDVSPEGPGHSRTLIAHRVGLPPKFQFRDAQKGPHDLPIIRDRKTGRLFELAPTQFSARKLPLVRNTANRLVEIQRAEFNANNAPTFFDPSGKRIDFIQPRDKNLTTQDILEMQKITISGRTIFFDAFGDVLQAEQAEADGGVLVGQNNSLVYYTIEVNDVFAYLASGVNSNPQMITATQFPTSASDLTAILGYATTKGVTSFPDSEALAIELKTAWVEATNLPSGCNYITMLAQIPTYDTTTNPAQWKKTGTKNATLAMVGMHVVGSTAGHPEMIWATFEHVCNAPSSSYTYNGGSLNEPGPVETGPWLFSSTNTPVTPNVQRQNYIDTTNPPEIDANTFQTIYPQTIGPADIQRIRPWGMPGTNSTSNTQVLATNHSVLSQLIAGDLRANYIMTGATWRPFGALSGAGVGTSQLANTTMETFGQGGNCFQCHKGNPLGDHLQPTGHSHIFGELQPLP